MNTHVWHQLALCPWASHSDSLGFISLICKMRSLICIRDSQEQSPLPSQLHYSLGKPCYGYNPREWTKFCILVTSLTTYTGILCGNNGLDIAKTSTILYTEFIQLLSEKKKTEACWSRSIIPPMETSSTAPRSWPQWSWNRDEGLTETRKWAARFGVPTPPSVRLWTCLLPLKT